MSKLTPTQVTEATLGDVAFDGIRRRPVVAIDENGKMVVCCRKTAKVNGWEVTGALHQRQRSHIDAQGKLASGDHPQRRKMDREGVVALPKDKVSALKDSMSTQIDALLGK